MFQLRYFKIAVFFSAAFLLLFSMQLMAEDELEVSKDFTLFTSKNLQGYLQPLFTTVGESFNTNMFTNAIYDDHWTIALDISINGMFIPNSNKTYLAELPEPYGDMDVVDIAGLRGGDIIRNETGAYKKQPTIYGGHSYAVFSSPQNHYSSTGEYGGYPDSVFKSVAFVEGNNINFMSGVPVPLQLIAGFPTRTQLRVRFWGAPVQDVFMYYAAGMVNQQVDHFVDLFGEDTTMGIAVNLAYHTLNRDPGLVLNSFSAGMHFSKAWDNGISVYSGLQYENLTGEFKAVRTNFNPDDVANSPYLEVRSGQDLAFNIEGSNNFRFLGGVSYRTGILEIHGDAAWAEQPVLSLGLTLWVASWGKKVREQEKIEQFEEIERIERIKKEEKREKK